MFGTIQPATTDEALALIKNNGYIVTTKISRRFATVTNKACELQAAVVIPAALIRSLIAAGSLTTYKGESDRWIAR